LPEKCAVNLMHVNVFMRDKSAMKTEGILLGHGFQYSYFFGGTV